MRDNNFSKEIGTLLSFIHGFVRRDNSIWSGLFNRLYENSPFISMVNNATFQRQVDCYAFLLMKDAVPYVIIIK